MLVWREQKRELLGTGENRIKELLPRDCQGIGNGGVR